MTANGLRCTALLTWLTVLAACGGSTFEQASGDGAAAESGSEDAAGGAGNASDGADGEASTEASADVDASADAAGDAATCSPACGAGRACCAGHCVNLDNDPTHCGACGTKCGGAKPFCDGTCQATPCSAGGAACSNGSCCGTQCCSTSQICCSPQGPIAGAPQCETVSDEHPTCSQGCAPLCISDRAVKHDITAVDSLAVLESVSRMPVATWSYNSDPAGIRHMGPMAQDFKAAFGLGDTDKAYYAIDAHGVTLAAIQALYELNMQQALRVERLEHENAELRARMMRVEQR